MKSLFAALFAASLTSNEVSVSRDVTPVENKNNITEIKKAPPIPQKDPDATTILRKVTETTKSRKNITLDFTFVVKNGKMEETQKGKLKIKDNNYWYEIFGTIKISDGKSICEVITEDQEVSITDANFNDPDEFSPQEMFSIYEKGYKYRYMGKKTQNGVELDLIDLYPDADNTQPYRRVTLFVNTSTNEIQKIELFHKTSAKVFSVSINKALYDTEMSEEIFKCECKRWPSEKGWDCDDQRNSK